MAGCLQGLVGRVAKMLTCFNCSLRTGISRNSCIDEMLQHRSRVCEAHEAQASRKEVVGIWEEAAD